MRVIFLTLYPEAAASPRYRIHQFIPYLSAQGVECTVACAVETGIWEDYCGPERKGRPFWYHWHETRQRWRQLKTLEEFDCVVLQKGIMSAYVKGMERYLDPVAHKLIYDVDDAVHLGPPHSLGRRWAWLEDGGQIEKVLARSALVLAGNHWLMEMAAAHAQRVEYFPTVVDTERFVPGTAEVTDYTPGWMGSYSTQGNLSAILPLLGDTAVLSVGSRFEAGAYPGVTQEAWTLADEVKQIQRMSVGLMPLEATDWNRGKCGLKALQYMACGVPCVASDWGAAREVIAAGETGYLVRDNEGWQEAVEALQDPALRRKMGEAGRERVEAHYSLKQGAPRLLSLLESVQ